MAEPMITALAPDGTPIEVPAGAAARLNAGHEGHTLSPHEGDALRHQVDLQDRMSGVEGYVAPLATGVARGLSFGLSDQLANLSPAIRQRLQDYEEYSPMATTGGEMIGLVGGSLAGVGPAGWVGRGGRALEAGIGEAIGGESMLARLAGKTLGSAAAGGLENGLYEAGKAESDAAIHNEALTGEQLVAATTHGIAFGGGLGAAFGGLGGLASEGFRSAGKTLSELGSPAAEAEAVAAPAAKGTLADELTKQADVKTIKALGGSAGDIRKLEATVPGGFRRVAQDIREDVEASTGKSIGHQSREALHEYATKRVDELGESLGKQLEKLDEAKTGVAPDPKRFLGKVADAFKDSFTRGPDGLPVALPGQEKTVAALQKWTKRIDEVFADRAPTFKEWKKIDNGLREEAFAAAEKKSIKAGALRRLRGILEGELVTAGEQAAQSVGGSFEAEYTNTKRLYQSVKKAQELTTRGVSRDLVNNSAGPFTRLSGMAGAGLGAAMGGGLGAMIGGAAGSAVGQVVQRRGDVLAADLLSRAATIAGANRVAGRVTSELNAGVRKLIPAIADSAGRLAEGAATTARRATGPLGVKMTGTQRSDFPRLADTVTASVANPLATADRVSRSLGPLADHAPGTASAAVQTTLRGLSFLASKLPPSRQDQYSLQPQLQKGSRASDAEISRFMRYAQAVDDPLIVLREAKTNTLTRDHVEAVKAVYPNLYDEIRGSVFRSLVESKTELPYARRIQLGILLDIPTDKTLSPEYIRAVQATFSSVDQAGAESPPQTGAIPNIASSLQTATQSAAEPAG